MRLLFFLCLFSTTVLRAQEPVAPAPEVFAEDTLILGEAEEKGPWKRFWTDKYPNPKKALLLSFVLPGAGQVYNKKWWKVPIVYATLGTLTWLEIDNLREYRALRDNYRYLVDGDPNTNPTEEPYVFLDATRMRFYRDQYRRYVELSSVGLGLAYVLAATDAFVDAHLGSFDVSDDLSLRVRPRFEQGPGLAPTLGMGLSLQLGVSRPAQPRQHWTTQP